MILDNKIFSRMHDASFVGINFILAENDVVKDVSLKLTDVFDKHFDLIFLDVIEFKIQNLTRQNVILDFQILSTEKEIIDYLSKSNFSNFKYTSNELNGLYLAIFTPSVGAEAFFLFKNIIYN